MALRHIALALLVVAGFYFAGVVTTSVSFTGPGDATGTASPTSTPRFDADGPHASRFDPPYDQDHVFDRVERLRGLESNATMPVETLRAADERGSLSTFSSTSTG